VTQILARNVKKYRDERYKHREFADQVNMVADAYLGPEGRPIYREWVVRLEALPDNGRAHEFVVPLEVCEVFYQIIPGLREEVFQELQRWFTSPFERWMPKTNPTTANIETVLSNFYPACQFDVLASGDDFSFLRKAAMVLLDLINSLQGDHRLIILITGGTTQELIGRVIADLQSDSRYRVKRELKFVATNNVQHHLKTEKNAENVAGQWAKAFPGAQKKTAIPTLDDTDAMNEYMDLLNNADLVVACAGGPNSYVRTHLATSDTEEFVGDFGYLPINAFGEEVKLPPGHRQYLSIKRLQTWQKTRVPVFAPIMQATKADITRLVLKHKLTSHVCLGHDLARSLKR
jgi:hypothetical protein